MAGAAGPEATVKPDPVAAPAPTTANVIEDLTPVQRTQKHFAKLLGPNKLARATFTALCTGQPLTVAQKECFFQIAERPRAADGTELPKLSADAAKVMLRVAGGDGITSAELQNLEIEAKAAGLPKNVINSFAARVSENAGPGCISVILEAHALLKGEESAVDVDDSSILSVRVLRDMVADRPIRGPDLARFLIALTGADFSAERFWSRFARDVCAVPDSELEVVITQEVLLGRGVREAGGQSDRFSVVEDLFDAIESGRPPLTRPPPPEQAVTTGAQALLAALADDTVDEDELIAIYKAIEKLPVPRKSGATADIDDADLELGSRLQGGGGGKKKKNKKAKKNAEEEPEQAEAEAQPEEQDPEEQDPEEPEVLDDIDPSPSPRGAGLTIPDVMKVAATVTRTARINQLIEVADDREEEKLLVCYKALLRHIQSRDGESHLIRHWPGQPLASPATLMPRDEFVANFAEYVKLLAQFELDDESTMDADGSVAPATTKKKQSKQADKRRQALITMDIMHDSDDSDDDEDSANGIPVPKGAREFLRFLNQGFPSARRMRDAPMAIAAVLYVAVDKQLPHEMAVSLQHLLVGAVLDADDVAHLLALQSDTRNVNDKRKSLRSAVENYRELTAAVWEHMAPSIGDDDANGVLDQSEDPHLTAGGQIAIAGASPRGIHTLVEGPAKTLRQLACAEPSVTEAEIAELYDIAKDNLEPHWLGNGGLEGLFHGNWPEQLEVATPPAEGVKVVNPMAAMDDDEVYMNNPLDLGGRMQGGGSGTWVVSGKEPDSDTELPDEAGDEEQEEVPRKSGATADIDDADLELGSRLQGGGGGKKHKKKKKRSGKEPDSDTELPDEAEDEEEEQEDEPKLSKKELKAQEKALKKSKGKKSKKKLSKKEQSAADEAAAAEEAARVAEAESIAEAEAAEAEAAEAKAQAEAERADKPSKKELKAQAKAEKAETKRLAKEAKQSAKAKKKQDSSDGPGLGVALAVGAGGAAAYAAFGGSDDDDSDADHNADMETGVEDEIPPEPELEEIVEPLDPDAAAALREFAEQFKPRAVETADQSLVRLIVATSKNVSTISAFQTLIDPTKAPEEEHMKALFEIAATQDVPADVIEVLVWMWTGGQGTSDQMLEKMVGGRRGHQLKSAPHDNFEPGRLGVTVVSAAGLTQAVPSFCACRVEGHQRNTQTVSKSTDPAWEANDMDSASFEFRVSDKGSAIVELIVYNDIKKGPDEEMGCVTLPLDKIEAGRTFIQTFSMEPTRAMNDNLKGKLGELTIKLAFTVADDVKTLEAMSPKVASSVDSLRPGALSNDSQQEKVPESSRKMSKKERKAAKKAEKAAAKAKLQADKNAAKQAAVPQAELSMWGGISGIMTTGPVERLVDAMKDAETGGVMNAEVITLIREAASVTIARTKETVENPKQSPTLQQIQDTALAGMSQGTDSTDGTSYDLQEDLNKEAKCHPSPMEYKYQTAISFCFARFLGFNPGVLSMFEHTADKLTASPESVGGFAAATLGCLGMAPKTLSGIKRYLHNRMDDEFRKLVFAGRFDKDWSTQLKKICRGEGCAASCVSYAIERIGEADAFGTAAALLRLRSGEGSAELRECLELESLVATCGDNFIEAGMQNLTRLIWPAREETFEMLRALCAPSPGAEAALSGWENRAELALILKTDFKATEALRGLVAIENLKQYLQAKSVFGGENLELIALEKLMRGDKSAMAIMRKLTPSIRDHIRLWWRDTGKLAKAKLLLGVGCLVVFVGLKVIFAFLSLVGLHDTIIGDAIIYVVDLVLIIAASVIGVFAAIWFIMKGKPYRDNIIGPPKVGVELLRKLAEAGEDPDNREVRKRALGDMLMGKESDTEPRGFFLNRATKFREKVPEGLIAYECMECMRILQQAGKSTTRIDEFDANVRWPSIRDLWPPSKDKLMEAKTTVVYKVREFFFFATIHPWMKKYAKYSGNRSVLFQAVEVPLTMQPDNANKFAALDKLNQLQRPDPEATRVVFEDDGETVKMEAVEMIDSGEQDEEGNPILQPILDKEGTPIMVPVVEECGLQKLQAVLEEIERLHKHGAPASSLRAAMGQQHRQGNVGEIFDAVDTDESGYVDVDEFTAAGRALADSVGFTISETELRDEFDSIDVDGGGMIEKLEFTEWWTEFTVDRKEAKLEKQAALEAVGLRDEMPSTKELKKLLTMLWNLTPTIGMNAAAFEALEDLCPDDETFDLLQDCYNLCDLKRTMITDSNARDAIIGLEALCVVPKLLEGDERLHIPANPEAMAVLKKVEEGNEAALLALQNLRQREVRRMWAMLTGRQRRFVLVAGAVAGYPLLMLATGGAITMEMFTEMFDELPECNYTNASYAENGPVNVSCVDAVRETGSWQEGDSNLENMDTPADSNSTGVGEDNFTNPSFYVLGFTPMVLSLFVTLFGQRIASIITMIMVFISSASVGIGSALNDGSDEFTPAKLVGVAGGCYAGGMALKVASSNIKFAYGVQGAAIGATVCRMTTQLWQPKLLLLVPEVEPHLGWVDISMAAVCAAGAAKIANKFRGVISIVSTAAIGTLGSIQMMSAYGIPHMDRFTIDSLMSGRAMCGSEESGCWGALATGLTLVYAGTLNQFKMAAMDFSLPAVTIYEKLLAKVDKSMTLLFALNEYLSGEVSMDMDDLMQRALNARDAMAKYMSLFANLGMFSLTLGFFADFFVNLTNGVFAAAPWVGMCSLAMAIVTPIQATIGVLSDTFTAKRFLNRVQEFRVPKFLKKIPLLNKFKAFAQGSFIVNFDKVGAFLQELSFRFGMLNMFIAMAIAGMSYVTATMYAIQVRANWDEMSLEMPDYTMDQAIAKVEATVNGLGDSAMGLITILGAGISATAFNLGGMSWLLTNLVNMEKFFVLGAGAIIGGMSFKMGSDWPAGSYMFAPLGLTGIVTLLVGGVQAIPWFSKKFPDFMFILHKIQIIIGVGLVAMFVVMMQTARKTHEFISDNWDGCKFPDVCDLVGKGNWSFAQYAQEQNMNKDDLEGFVQPMMYAGSLSCLATMGMLVGGSNLSKFLYYKNVMSRKEELAAEQGGEDKAAVRQAALMKKVRKTRQGDIDMVAGTIQNNAFVDLEEQALIMELATGTPMELHYDLVAHDDTLEEIGQSKRRQAASGDALAGHMDDDISDDDDAEESNQGAGAMDTGSTLAALAKQMRLTQGHGISSAPPDARVEESASLEQRAAGAKELVAKAKAERLAEWSSMPIFNKRDAVYAIIRGSDDQGDKSAAGGGLLSGTVVPHW